MDVSSPISSVIPSLDGAVLGALSGTTAPLTLTRVHEIAATGSLSGVRRVLVRLVGTGIVHSMPGGYVLNRDHVAAPAIECLARLWGEVLDRIGRAIGEWEVPPALVGVYGSAARRAGDEGSDIDLLVVSDALDASERAAHLAGYVERWTGNVAHVVTLDRADIVRMRRASEPVLDEWDRDLVVVAGDRHVLRSPD